MMSFILSMNQIMKERDVSYSQGCDFHFWWDGIAMGFVSMLGYVCNILAFSVLCGADRARVSFYLLKLLTTTDFIFIVLYSFIMVWPTIVFGVLEEDAKYTLLWDICTYARVYAWPILTMTISTSTWMTVLLAVHRYIAIANPLEAHIRSTILRARTQVIIIIAISVILELPRFFEYTIIEVEGALNATYKDVILRDFYFNPYYQLLYKNCIVGLYKIYIPLIITIVMSYLLIKNL